MDASRAAASGWAVAAPGVQRFIDAHRHSGHRCAALDPLGLTVAGDASRLAPSAFGLGPADPLTLDGSALAGVRSVAELDRQLKAVYCGPVAMDCSALRDDARAAWLYEQMESGTNQSDHDKSALLTRLARVEAWEHHVVERFPDAKRFSLEGCETLVPLVDALIEQASGRGVTDVFMGMPHRGRVNVLVNLLGMPPAELLDYFDADSPHPEKHRDLVYHLGAQCDIATPTGKVSVTLAHNPSHLQSVYPVVIGMTRASQSGTKGQQDVHKSMPIVLHGDAAFAGQGVVMETLVLSQAPGYSVGGAIHVVINNQVGFTRPNPMDPLAHRYASDVTRIVDAPVIRVNADAPDQVFRVAQIAVAYRMKFGADIVIDLIGYRRLGHSEHDMPEVTNPGLYAAIASHPSVVDVYASAMVELGVGARADVESIITRGRAASVAAFRAGASPGAAPPQATPEPAQPPAWTPAQVTAAVASMTAVPPGFRAHPYVARLMARWQAAGADPDAVVDWNFAENMAYASVLCSGVDVRISGMDVCRGTFLHRHAVWHDQAAAPGPDADFVPLQQLGAHAGRFDVVNSVLSEEAVLGFEYGYSVQSQHALTIWEAQFGDFVNGAQVYIDQYIAAGEEKWGYRSALTLLLPHGYEGIGPEHSTGYLSRFLEVCGGHNIEVAYPSTAAQMFHLLRRQAFRSDRKPLVVMTPKTTLYQDESSHSRRQALSDGNFQPVLDDDEAPDAGDVTKVVLCSGKLYHDLRRARRSGGRKDVALLRLEQLYPFPRQQLAALLKRYDQLAMLVWAQEENRNQGAWSFVRDELAAVCPPGSALCEVSRPVTASGATSSKAIHKRQQSELVARALGPVQARRSVPGPDIEP